MARTSASPRPASAPAASASALGTAAAATATATTDQPGQAAASPGPGRPTNKVAALKLEASGLNGAAWQPKAARRERVAVAKFEPVMEPLVKRRKREEKEEEEEEEAQQGEDEAGESDEEKEDSSKQQHKKAKTEGKASKPKSKSLQELLKEKAAAKAATAAAKVKDAAAAEKQSSSKGKGKGKGKPKAAEVKKEALERPQLPLLPPRMSEREFALPEAWIKEVQLQPPPKFRVLRQNCYSDPSLRPLREDPPSCHCAPGTGCDHNCMNRQLFMECAPGKCPSLDQAVGQRFCSNMVIQERRFHPTEVFKTGDRGWALRTTAPAKTGTVLIEYLGEVVTMEEGQERMHRMTGEHDFYFASLEAGLLLDAGPMGSDARFANHSCAPNCMMQKWTVAGEPHIVLVAQRDLAAGEEVTYNYQLDTLEGCFGQQPCRCGARNCSGFIGKRPQGSGLGPREAWRAAARKLLEMRMPPLVALQGLLAEARALGVGAGAGGGAWRPMPEATTAAAEAPAAAASAEIGDEPEKGKGDGEEEYVALAAKAEAVEGWLVRYRHLMGGWREPQAAAEGSEADAGSVVIVKQEDDAATVATSTSAGPSACALVEMEALAALVAEAPKDVKFPQATQARNTLTRARQARTALRVLYETALRNWAAPAPSPPTLPSLPTDADAADPAMAKPEEKQQAMDVVIPPEPEAAATAPAAVAATTARDSALSAAAGAAAAVAATGAAAPADVPAASAGSGGGPWEFVPGGATMKEVVSLLRDALDCAPVRVPGLGPAVEMLLEVDAWATGACQRLGIKFKDKDGEGPGKGEPEAEEGDGARPLTRREQRQRKAADADPGMLLRRLARLYNGEEGLSPQRVAGAFKGLEALEAALADMVEMVICREECKEHERAFQQQQEEQEVKKHPPPPPQQQQQPSQPAPEAAALSASFTSITTTGTEQQAALPAAPVNGKAAAAATTAAASVAGIDGGASGATAEEGAGRRASRRAAARKKEKEEEAAAPSGNGESSSKKKGGKAVVAPPPEPLRCFCRLPEHEGKMRTLVQCAGCEEWYHPHCVSLAVKEIRYLKGDDYLCPVCRHQRGLASELAAPPLAGRFGLVRASRPRLEAVRALWGETRALTIAEFEAVPFLSFLLDAAEQWRGRTRGALLALLPAFEDTGTGEEAANATDAATQEALAALAAEAEAAEQEKAERRAAEEAEAAAAAAKARAARERKSGPVPPPPPRRKLPSAAESRWEAHEREELAAIVRALRETAAAANAGAALEARLAAEARALRFAARLMCEHRVLEITVSEQLVERLKALLWRIVGPLCLPSPGLLALTATAEAADDAAKEAKAQQAREELQALLDSAGALRQGQDRARAEAEEARKKAAAKAVLARARRLGRRMGLEMLCAVVEEGRRLGLSAGRAWKRLAEARDDALFWLRTAASLPFPRLLPAVLAGRGCPGLCDATAPALGAPPREALIDYHGEWGYSRARAAVVRSNRLHGHLPPVEGREHLPRPPVTGPKVMWEVDKGLVDAPGEQFCVCRGQESGEMVCCEGCGEWHHFDCVGYRPPAAAMAKGGSKKKREEREDGEAAYACIGCSEEAGRPYRYKWTTALFKAYAGLKVTPSEAVPTDAAAVLPAAAADEEAMYASMRQQLQLQQANHKPKAQPQRALALAASATNGYRHQQHHAPRASAVPPPPATAPSVASAFAAFSQRAYASAPEPPVPPPPPIPAVAAAEAAQAAMGTHEVPFHHQQHQQHQLAPQHQPQQQQQQPSAAALAEQVMRMVQMQQQQHQLQLQQQQQQQAAVAAAAAMYLAPVAAAPQMAACAPAVLSASSMASMVPAGIVPASLVPAQQQQQQPQQLTAAATAAAALPPAPFVVRQNSEASSLGIGGGSGDWGIDENAELLDSFFVGGSQ